MPDDDQDTAGHKPAEVNTAERDRRPPVAKPDTLIPPVGEVPAALAEKGEWLSAPRESHEEAEYRAALFSYFTRFACGRWGNPAAPLEWVPPEAMAKYLRIDTTLKDVLISDGTGERWFGVRSVTVDQYTEWVAEQAREAAAQETAPPADEQVVETPASETPLPPDGSRLSYQEAAKLIIQGVKDGTYADRWSGIKALKHRVRSKGKGSSIRRRLYEVCKELAGRVRT